MALIDTPKRPWKAQIWKDCYTQLRQNWSKGISTLWNMKNGSKRFSNTFFKARPDPYLILI